MSATVDRGTLDRLIALGRARGALTAEDLRAALPVEAMDVDALVLLMLELEEAGIGVEPEALGPRADAPAPTAPDLPPPADAAPPPAGRPAEHAPAAPTARPAGEAADAPAPAGAPGGTEWIDRLVLVSGLAVFLVLALLLVLL